MTDRTLYLFPDTNVFVQCKPLKELDWSEWSDFSEVHLLVSRPVQREIDNQKNRGNNRVANRARLTYRTFREIFEGQLGHKVIQDSQPLVKLYLEGPNLPSPALKDRLDYSKPDDEIVGHLHSFMKENPGAEARLLTHDSGPMMTAFALSLPAILVKDEWLLPPESNELEKENARLQNRVIELEKAEPSFDVQLIDDSEQNSENLEVEYEVFEPLSEQEVNALVQLIAENLPVATGFPKNPPPRKDNSTTVGIFYLPTDGEIAKYKEQDYPEWLEKCRAALSSIHTELQKEVGPPAFSLSITNEGTRPGKDTLVNIIAEGKLEISPPPLGSASERALQEGPTLPYPPQPPQGRWGSQEGFQRRPRSLRLSTRNQTTLQNLKATIRNSYPISTPSTWAQPPQKTNATPPDPNTVYFKYETSRYTRQNHHPRVPAMASRHGFSQIPRGPAFRSGLRKRTRAADLRSARGEPVFPCSRAIPPCG